MWPTTRIVNTIKPRNTKRTGHVSGMESKFIQHFCAKPQGRRPVGKPRHMWEDNI